MVSMQNTRGDFTRRFGELLHRARVTRSLSQEQLAHEARLHRTEISLIERGQRSIRLETLERLANALSIEPALLIPSSAGPESQRPGTGTAMHHPDKERFDRIFPYIRECQRLAAEHGIRDIFQDNGGKLLQTLLILDLTYTGRREGNDAVDRDGNEYELKTVNEQLTRSFSTHHHLNPVILKKYRNVKAWYFSIYIDIELIEIYQMLPGQLEADYFSVWERKWHEMNKKDLNNPKIPVRYVREHGELIYRDPVDNRL